MKEFVYPRGIKPQYRGSNLIDINGLKYVIITADTKFSKYHGRFLTFLYMISEKEVNQDLVDSAYKEYLENPAVLPKKFKIGICGDFLDEEEYKVDDVEHKDDILDISIFNTSNVNVIGKVIRKGKYRKECWGHDPLYVGRSYENVEV